MQRDCPGFFGPVFRSAAGHDPHIVLRLRWEAALAGKPFLDSAAARIVSRGCQSEISKLVLQFSQESRRCRKRLERIEGVFEPDLGCGVRHELRDAFGTDMA